MSVLKTLRLTQAAPTPAASTAKDRLRLKAENFLREQQACYAAHLEGKPFEVVRNVVKVNAAGERVRVARPKFVKKSWFEDSAGVVFFGIRYGGHKLLRLDKTGNTSVEVGKLEALPTVLDALMNAVKGGELDAALAAAAQERSKAFTRRKTKAE